MLHVNFPLLLIGNNIFHFVMMHDSFVAHCLSTFFFSWASKKILHERREKQSELRNRVLKYCCLIFIGYLLSYGDQSNPAFLVRSLPTPYPLLGAAQGVLLETDCRQYVGIFHSEWTLIYWIEKKAFRNVSFVKTGWLLKRDREMLNVLYVSIDYFCSDS